MPRLLLGLQVYFPASSGLTRKMMRVPSMRMRTLSFRSLRRDADALSDRQSNMTGQSSVFLSLPFLFFLHPCRHEILKGAMWEQQRVKPRPSRDPENTESTARDSNTSVNCHFVYIVQPSIQNQSANNNMTLCTSFLFSIYLFLCWYFYYFILILHSFLLCFGICIHCMHQWITANSLFVKTYISMHLFLFYCEIKKNITIELQLINTANMFYIKYVLHCNRFTWWVYGLYEIWFGKLFSRVL